MGNASTNNLSLIRESAAAVSVSSVDVAGQDNAEASTFRTCLWLFLFLLAYRLLRAFVFKRDLTNDDCEVDRVAFALANHLGFSNPFKIPTGPTSQYAPAYPLILSWIYTLFGTGTTGEAVRQILTCCVTSLQFALLPALAVAANMSYRVGVLAGLLGGLSPLRHRIETEGTFETPYAALLLVILTLLTLQMWDVDRPSSMRAWLHGVAWGVALLFAPQLMPVLFGYLALGAFRFSSSKLRSYLSFSLILLFATAIVLAPWTIRNYQVFHRLMFVRRGYALMLSLSYNNSALPAWEQNMYTKEYMNIAPLSNLSAAQEVGRFGESAYYDKQFHAAYKWIGSHPRRFLRLTADHFRYFWFPPLEPHIKGNISSFLTWCVTLTGIAGLFLMLQHRRWPAFGIGVVWLAYPLAYYFVEFSSRYRYPIEWTFLFTAAYAIATLLGRVIPGTIREQFNLHVRTLTVWPIWGAPARCAPLQK